MNRYLTRVLVLAVLLALPMLFTSGCVTIEYVDQQVSRLEGMIAEDRSRIDDLESRVVANSAAIVDLRSQKVVNRVILEEEVLFDSGDSTLATAAKDILDTLASDALRSGYDWILVAGHTDSDGSAKSNYLLGLHRAHSVAAYLAVEAGMDRRKIIVNSYGENAPSSTNETAQGKATNRRVEITVYQSSL